MKTHKGKSNVGILGYGEVGQAMAKFYKNPRVKDLKRKDDLSGVELLHVCIPWSDTFVATVSKEIAKARPKLTIIHSTVPPKTTQKLGPMTVHSPIRGIHPKLYQGVKTFVKYIGADNKKAAKFAEQHFKNIGIKTKTFYPSTTTEIGKLLDTTYYGLVIAWHGEMKKITDALGVDFEQAVTHFNQTYNEGYKKLGKHNVVRPVLSAPQNHIGGHCIVPNTKLLKGHLDSKAIDLILGYEKKVQES